MTKLTTTIKTKTKFANIKVRNVKVFNDMKITDHSINDKNQKKLLKEVLRG